MKLRNKIILKTLFHSILQLIMLLLFAWFNYCIFEMIIIYCCFFYFRTKFEKQYHAITAWGCTAITILVYYVVSSIVPLKSISILLSVLMAYAINTVSYYVRDYMDIKNPKPKKHNTNRQLIIQILGIDNLEEEQIEKFCISKGEPNLSETIYLFLNNTLEDTAEILDINSSTVTRRIKKFIEIGLD